MDDLRPLNATRFAGKPQIQVVEIQVVEKYSNSNETPLEVHLFLAPGISGRESQLADELPERVEPKFVRLVKGLARTVRASVMCLSGKLLLPEPEHQP